MLGLNPEVTPAHMMSSASMTPEQQALMSKLIGQVSPQVGQGVSPYPGTYTPGVSSLQQGGFDAIQSMLGGGGAYGMGGEALNRILGGTPEESLAAKMGPTGTSAAGVMGPTGGGFNKESAMDAWTKSVKDPAMQTWQNEMIPKILEPFVGAGGLNSGAARRAVAESGRNLNTDITGKLADMLYQGEQAGAGREFAGKESYAERSQSASESALGRQFGAGESYRDRVGGTEESYLNRLLGTVPQAMNYATTPAQMALEAGGTQRGIAGEQGQEDLNKWQMSQSYNNPWMSTMMGLLNLNPYTQGMAQQQSTPGWGQNILSSLGQTSKSQTGMFGLLGI